MLLKDLALPSKTFAIAEMKRLVKEHDGKLSLEDQAKIIEEIEAMNFDEWQDKIRLIDDDKLKLKSASPGEQQQSKQTGTMVEVKKEAMKKKVGPNNKMRQS
jgi:hypothetical protein